MRGSVITAILSAAAGASLGLGVNSLGKQQLVRDVALSMVTVRATSARDVGFGCEIGVGECTNRGVYVSKNGTLVCSVLEAGVPEVELCGDNRDNNCDGQTDESCVE